MFLEIEDETRNFSTNFRKEYSPKKLSKIFKTKPCFSEDLERDPIAEAFKEYLYLSKINDRLPHRRRSETLKNHLERLRKENPNLQKFLPKEPPNEAVVAREKKRRCCSIYQTDYGWRTAQFATNKKKSTIKLPDDTPIPETTQNKFYRHPLIFDPNGVLKNKGLIKLKDNLVINERERKILRVRTGDSEYGGGSIGKVAKKILKEQIYGPPKPIDPPPVHIKGPDSPRSVCSQIRLHTSKKIILSNVF